MRICKQTSVTEHVWSNSRAHGNTKGELVCLWVHPGISYTDRHSDKIQSAWSTSYQEGAVKTEENQRRRNSSQKSPSACVWSSSGCLDRKLDCDTRVKNEHTAVSGGQFARTLFQGWLPSHSCLECCIGDTHWDPYSHHYRSVGSEFQGSGKLTF